MKSRRGPSRFLVTVIIAGVVAGIVPAGASTTPSVPPVSHLRVSEVTISSLLPTWRLPGTSAVSGALIRMSESRTAPKAVSKGTGLGNVPRARNTLAVKHLATSTWYSFSVFAHDRHGHFARARVSL